MKIILVIEGSYPYVKGGVASWVQQLVTAMPEHEFEIVALSSSRVEAKERQYKLPPNVTRIHDIYITDCLEPAAGRPPRLSKKEELACRNWFEFKEGAEAALPVLADPRKLGSPLSFLQSEPIWELMTESYRSETPDGSFSSYFWAWRSLYVPAVYFLQQTYPEGDLYHAVSTGYAGLIAASMRMKHGTPFVLTEHGLYAREREEEIMRSESVAPGYKRRWVSYFYHLARIAYRTADRTVALYDGARRFQLGQGVPPRRAAVIPNGVPYAVLAGLPRLTDPSGETFVFGVLARVVPIKDILMLLQAARIASQHIPGMQVWIMGPTDEEPDYYKECFMLAAELKIESIVTFTGQVRISDYLPRTDALLMSSISEGQPLAVLEGMAAGIPWVCTDVGSCRELLEGRDGDDAGAAGYIVPPGNPEAMAEAMIRLYRDPKLRVSMGQAGRRRVESCYQIDRFVDAYRRLYKEVTS